MSDRRNFIKKATLGALCIGSLYRAQDSNAAPINFEKAGARKEVKKPLIISTWNHGLPANKEALQQLSKGKPPLDAIVAGVGIMDHLSNCGSVSFLQGIKHPIAVAQKVLLETPHVMLAGAGALKFALSQGFKEENLLTAETKKDWKKWLKASKYKPVINTENHDTISMLILDEDGNLSGGCTTSGAAWKMHGRVGDSPIIGAGLFLDNDIGAAAATGLGEAVIRTAGSAMVVELMRQGKTPDEACKEIVERIYNKHKDHKDMEYLQVGFIAVNKAGIHGGYSLRNGFNYAVYDKDAGHRMEDAAFKMSWE